MKCTLSITLLLLTSFSSALAHPPTVISASPDNADFAVDPALTTLRITFDQDMTPQMHSICGGGPTMPAITGKPTWESPRTILIPVKLEPDHLYSFSINCPSARNFSSAAIAGKPSEPATPYPISFRTASANQKLVSLAPAATQAMTKSLRDAINNKYSYRDRLKLDWNAIFDADQSLASTTTPSSFARAAAKLLSAAHDPHLILKVGDSANPDATFTISTHARNVIPNINTRWLSKNIPGMKRQSSAVFSGTLQDGIGYILISSWSGTPAEFAPLEVVLKEFKAANASALIIDVRPNGGGSETYARDFASHFITQPAVYSKSRIRNTDAPTGFSGPFDRIVEPSPQSTRYTANVAVLMGPANLSSCESFILMMKQSPNVRLFGEQTGGSSGNPKPVDLGHGVTLLVPSWIDLLPDNSELEGRGISPDEIIKTAPAALESADPVLDAALKWLKSTPAK